MKLDFSGEIIWKSKNGVPYVNETLKRKQKVYSEAQLQKISHNNSGNDEICLKLGRYKIEGGVETEIPKSELTLDGDEFEALLKFISVFYKPMEMDVENFIPIDGSHSADLLKRFKDIALNDEEKGKLIIESGILNHNITSAIQYSLKHKTLNEFEKYLREDYLESFWQEWFSKNKWILGSDFSKIIDERRIDTNNIVDYLMETNDGFVDIVEIKKPNGLPFWNDAKDHDNYVPSQSLVKAIVQCQSYLLEIERESNSVKLMKKLGNATIAKPRCVLIYGRSYDWDEEKILAFRLLNSSLNQIMIMTYDQLLIRAKSLLQN